MEIQQKVIEFRFQILAAVGLGAAIICACFFAPSILDIVKFFSPLLMSTALFLVSIVFLGRISPPVSEATDEKPGEGLLNYVASEPEHMNLFDEVRESVGAHYINNAGAAVM